MSDFVKHAQILWHCPAQMRTTLGIHLDHCIQPPPNQNPWCFLCSWDTLKRWAKTKTWSMLGENITGQIILFHQPGFSCNKRGFPLLFTTIWGLEVLWACYNFDQKTSHPLLLYGLIFLWILHMQKGILHRVDKLIFSTPRWCNIPTSGGFHQGQRHKCLTGFLKKMASKSNSLYMYIYNIYIYYPE